MAGYIVACVLDDDGNPEAIQIEVGQTVFLGDYAFTAVADAATANAVAIRG
jgi:hypothetical protein